MPFPALRPYGRVSWGGCKTVGMTDKTIIAIFERLEDTDDPSALIEYATLVEREKEAEQARLEAIEAAGFDVPSIDQNGETD